MGDNNTIRIQSLQNFEREHWKDMEQTASSEKDIISELYNSKAERIKKYADSLAERVTLGDKELEITEKKLISGYMARKYRELGVSEGAIAYIRETLDEEYKNKAFQREQVELGNGLVAEINGEENLADLKKPVKQMDNLELQETDDYLKEKEANLKAELARVRDIKETVYEAATERHLSLPSMKESVISTPQPGERENAFSESLIDLGNCLVEIGHKAREFPPSREDEGRFTKAVKTWIDVVRPLTDLKFTKSTQGWLETIITFEQYGKHAAAVKNSVTTLNGTKRPLTREQVGDKAEIVLQGALDILNGDHLMNVLGQWHKDYVEPPVGTRKENVKPRLSDSA